MKINEVLKYSKFYNCVKEQKMPIKLAYRLSKLEKQINQEVAFYQERVQNLIQKYGELDPDGNPIVLENGGIKLKPETQANCQKEFNELDNLEIEVRFTPFNIEDFDNFDITPDEFQGIIPFLMD